MIEWTGVLALLDAPTADGKVLTTPERLLSRPLPLPILTLDGKPAAAITHLSIHGNQVRVEGTAREGLLTEERPAVPIALDADQTLWHQDGDHVIFTTWRIAGATLLLGADDRAPWPEAEIRLKGDRRD